MAIPAFQALIDDLGTYFEVSNKIGGPVAEQANHFKTALALSLAFIEQALRQKKPGEAELQKLLNPVSEAMGKVSEVESKYRGKEHINHLKTVAEGVPALGWVVVDNTPGPFVKETIGSSQFWSNKILREFKGKDEVQVNWVNNFTEFLQNLQKYIMQYHTTGLAWNSGGGAAAPAVVAYGGGGGGGASESEFQDLIDEHVVPYVAASEKIGGVVAEQAKLFKQAVDKELELIKKAAGQKKPSPDELSNLVAPVSGLMTQIAEIESKYRGKDLVNHLKAVAEGTPALGWVCVEPTPGPFVKEMIGASEFWSNKILREFKGKDENQVNWVNYFSGFLKGLVPYIMKNHATGLSWNTGGGRPLAAGPVAAAGGSGSEREFKEIIEEHISVYVTESDKIGGVVAEQAKLFKQACLLELELISQAAGKKKPTPEEFQKQIQPISDIMSKIAEVESKYRGKDHVNHLKTVAEGTPALGWVCVEPTPGPFVKETIGSSEFWSNKILKDYKGKDEGHVNWVKGFNGFLKALVTYILAHHTTGLSWNTTGGRTQAPASAVAAGSGSAQKAFEDIILEFVDPYVSISGEIGGEVATQAKLFKEAAQKSAELIGKASTQKKPTPDAFQTLLAPISDLMTKIAEVESKYRGKDLVNHLKTVSEGTPSLGWLCVEPTPGPYVKETIGSSEFWSNKVLREYKGKDEKHVNWVNAFNGFLKALVQYIMSYHTTGLTWKN